MLELGVAPIIERDTPTVRVNLLTPCEEQLHPLVPGFRSGRYPRRIAAAFPQRSGQALIHSYGSLKNLFCECMTAVMMLCQLRLIRGSDAWNTVRIKFRQTTSAGLRPFFIYGDHLAFSTHDIDPNVVAIISVREQDGTETGWARKMGKNPFNIKPIPIELCKPCHGDEPCCPISFTEFHRSDVVYVLKGEGGTDDLEKSPPVPVYCISFEAMQSIVKRSHRGIFIDPLRRRGEFRTGLFEYEIYKITANVGSEINSAGAGSSTDPLMIPTLAPTQNDGTFRGTDIFGRTGSSPFSSSGAGNFHDPLTSNPSSSPTHNGILSHGLNVANQLESLSINEERVQTTMQRHDYQAFKFFTFIFFIFSICTSCFNFFHQTNSSQKVYISFEDI